MRGTREGKSSRELRLSRAPLLLLPSDLHDALFGIIIYVFSQHERSRSNFPDQVSSHGEFILESSLSRPLSDRRSS